MKSRPDEPTAPPLTGMVLDARSKHSIMSFAIRNLRNDMSEKKTLLIAQVFMTFMMAFLMSGILSFIQMGPTSEWLHFWPSQFIIAWPIAFCLTLFVSKIAFGLAYKIGRRA